jgi:hypothetical protein
VFDVRHFTARKHASDINCTCEPDFKKQFYTAIALIINLDNSLGSKMFCNDCLQPSFFTRDFESRLYSFVDRIATLPLWYMLDEDLLTGMGTFCSPPDHIIPTSS